MDKGRVKIGPDIYQKVEIGLKPSEMVDIQITSEHKDKIKEMGLKKILVEIEEV
jgi:hypothetical protein